MTDGLSMSLFLFLYLKGCHLWVQQFVHHLAVWARKNQRPFVKRLPTVTCVTLKGHGAFLYRTINGVIELTRSRLEMGNKEWRAH